MRQFLYKTLIALSIGFILPQMVFAAQIFFESKTTQTQIGGKIEINLFVNTEQESINAFEGKMLFPSGVLDLKEIRDGNTIVNFWVEKPKNQNGAIIFSGITPGGFSGEKGLIFSAIFEAKKEGVAKFEINDARVLRNDGTGSEATLITVPFEIVVSRGAPAEIPAIPKIIDRERPESFVPEIARNETLLEGKWFVVFATQDKSSGIDHYEVKESRQKIFSVFGKWSAAESPYILADQELRSFVWIKAVDKTGNERVVKISPNNPLMGYENYENWIMIIVGVFIVALIARKLWKRKHI